MTVNVVPQGALVYGIQLPVQAKSVRTSAEWERGPEIGTQELVRAAIACDDAGFFYIAVCDHVSVPQTAAVDIGMSYTWYEPVATLSYLAGITKNARLMTNVYVAAYRHPLLTAKTFATLDALSGGRLILGIGAGHLEAEFNSLGVDFLARGSITNDAIDQIIGAWAATPAQLPAPLQSPRPPSWAGGSGTPALRRVAERCDGWIPQGTPRKDMAASIATITALRDAVRSGERLDIGYIHEYIYIGDETWDFGDYTVSGSDDRIIAKCNEMGAMGVNHLQIRLRARDIEEFCDQAAAFGERIGPHLVGKGSL